MEKPNCPRCTSSNVRKYGFTRRYHRQQWFCNDCHRKYIAIDFVQPKIDYGVCPYCKNNKLQSKGFRNDKRRLYCKTCGKHFTEGVELKEFKKPPCPFCGSERVWINSTYKDGRTCFKCTSCSKYFTEYQELTPALANKILIYYRAGVNKRDIIKHFKILKSDMDTLVGNI